MKLAQWFLMKGGYISNLDIGRQASEMNRICLAEAIKDEWIY